MVLRHENKHPPPVCKKGDGVIVKLTKNIKGKEKHFITDIKLNTRWKEMVNSIGFMSVRSLQRHRQKKLSENKIPK